MKKKILSLLLAVVMVVTLLPVTAFADETLTVADILNKADGGFPTTEAGAWSNDKGKKMYIENNGLTFGTVNISTILSQPVTEDGNNYKYTLSPHTITFVMDSGNLVKVKIEGAGNTDNNGGYFPPHTHDNIEFLPWDTTDSLPNEAGSYFLTEDVTLSSTWNVPTNKTVTLDLNGKVLKWTGNAEHNVIKVEGGGNLTLTDSNPTATHYFKYNDSSAWTWDDTATTDAITLDAITDSTAENTPIIVTGGCITGGTEIAVKVCGNNAGEGVFTMTGGNIVGNTATSGAGVYLEATFGSNENPCTFNMTGGRIIGNRATGYDMLLVGHVSGMGGGVLMNAAGSKFNMTGGEICRNTTDGNGGGVFVGSNGAFTMSGSSKISDNSSYQGAGVYSNGTFTMSENSMVSHNKGACGGGVLVDGGSFAMSGESIVSYNEGATWAGGVEVTNSGTFTMAENSKITYNKGKKGGGVSLFGNANFNMTGGRITDNTTPDCGGGVYFASSGTLTLGGTAKITDNLKGTAANNLYLDNYGGQKTVTLGTNGDAPATGFSVGVTLAGGTGVFTGENGADYSALFTPDAGTDNYNVINLTNDENKLKLVTKLDVTVANDIQNGTVTASAADGKAFEGDTVTITVTPDSGYKLKSLSYTPEGESAQAITKTNGVYSFTMPGKNIIITAEFKHVGSPYSPDEPGQLNPNTGDTSNIGLGVALMLISSLGAAACLKDGKKRRNTQ